MDHRQTALLTTRARVFKALGHPSRLAIVDELNRGPRCVGDLQPALGVNMSTVSRHLGVLREAGLVAAVKRGSHVEYTLRCPCVTTFYACVESVTGTQAPVDLRGGGPT